MFIIYLKMLIISVIYICIIILSVLFIIQYQELCYSNIMYNLKCKTYVQYFFIFLVKIYGTF